MKNVECPSPAAMFECPYWRDGMCTMPEEEGCHPRMECDDYYAYTGDEEE